MFKLISKLLLINHFNFEDLTGENEDSKVIVAINLLQQINIENNTLNILILNFFSEINVEYYTNNKIKITTNKEVLKIVLFSLITELNKRFGEVNDQQMKTLKLAISFYSPSQSKIIRELHIPLSKIKRFITYKKRIKNNVNEILDNKKVIQNLKIHVN